MLWHFIKNHFCTGHEQLTFPTNGKSFFDFTYRLPYTKRTCHLERWTWCSNELKKVCANERFLATMRFEGFLYHDIHLACTVRMYCTLQCEKSENFRLYRKVDLLVQSAYCIVLSSLYCSKLSFLWLQGKRRLLKIQHFQIIGLFSTFTA